MVLELCVKLTITRQLAIVLLDCKAVLMSLALISNVDLTMIAPKQKSVI